MSDVISFRLKEDEITHIEDYSQEFQTDRTTAARNLIEFGWRYHLLKEYRQGKKSFEQAAKNLHMSPIDFMDLLAELGIPSPITFEDYLSGLGTTRSMKKLRNST